MSCKSLKFAKWAQVPWTYFSVARNVRGNDRLFVHSSHDAHPFLEGVYESGNPDEVSSHISATVCRYVIHDLKSGYFLK